MKFNIECSALLFRKQYKTEKGLGFFFRIEMIPFLCRAETNTVSFLS